MNIQRVHNKSRVGLDDTVDVDECEDETFTRTSGVFGDTLEVVFDADGGWTEGVEFAYSALRHGQLKASNSRQINDQQSDVVRNSLQLEGRSSMCTDGRMDDRGNRGLLALQVR